MIVATCPNGESTLTHNGTEYSCVVSPHTDKVWLDRNLGASAVCTALDDTACYGDYYQWGRNFNGHEKSTSDVTEKLADDVNDAGTEFIKYSSSPLDWVSYAIDDAGATRNANWSKQMGVLYVL